MPPVFISIDVNASILCIILMYKWNNYLTDTFCLWCVRPLIEKRVRSNDEKKLEMVIESYLGASLSEIQLTTERFANDAKSLKKQLPQLVWKHLSEPIPSTPKKIPMLKPACSVPIKL
eukprot:UN08614